MTSSRGFPEVVTSSTGCPEVVTSSKGCREAVTSLRDDLGSGFLGSFEIRGEAR